MLFKESQYKWRPSFIPTNKMLSILLWASYAWLQVWSSYLKNKYDYEDNEYLAINGKEPRLKMRQPPKYM
jgi:hypothetical protein